MDTHPFAVIYRRALLELDHACNRRRDLMPEALAQYNATMALLQAWGLETMHGPGGDEVITRALAKQLRQEARDDEYAGGGE